MLGLSLGCTDDVRTTSAAILGTEVVGGIALGDELSRVQALMPTLEQRGPEWYRVRLEDGSSLSLTFGIVDDRRRTGGRLGLERIMRLWVGLPTPESEWGAANARISAVATQPPACDFLVADSFREARSIWEEDEIAGGVAHGGWLDAGAILR